MKRRSVVVVAVAMLALVIAGCASGPKFVPVAALDVPADKGLVYIYRTSSPLGFGVIYDVNAGSQKVVKLQNGGYFPYFCPPGQVEFWAMTEAKSSVTLNVEAGSTYYLRGTLTMGFFVGHPNLEIIPAEQAEKEIAECGLIPSE
jgi:hypothetical protein